MNTSIGHGKHRRTRADPIGRLALHTAAGASIAIEGSHGRPDKILVACDAPHIVVAPQVG